MKTPPLFIQQKRWPFFTKTIQLDIENHSLKVSQKSFFKADEIDIDVDTLNANTQKLKHVSWPWFAIATLVTLYTLACISTWFWKSPPSNASDFGFYIFSQIALALASCGSWVKFLTRSFNVTIFVNRYNGMAAVNLLNTKPDPETASHFVDNLKRLIQLREQTRTLHSILQEIPTHVLVDIFSTAYIDQLQTRGIDVSALLSFLQKRIANQHEIANRPV